MSEYDAGLPEGRQAQVNLINAKLLRSAKARRDLVLAVLIGRGGGRKIVCIEIEEGNGQGTKVIQDFVKEARPLLDRGEKLMAARFFGVSIKDLEAAASHVKVYD